MTLLDRQIDDDQAGKAIRISQVHQRSVGESLMCPSQVQDARRPGEASNELTPAHMHGQENIDNRNLSPEFLGMGQRLGHPVAG